MDRITMKAARINCGLTQKEAAKIIGISAKTLQLWETYKSSPNVKHIDKICQTYGRPYEGISFLRP